MSSKQKETSCTFRCDEEYKRHIYRRADDLDMSYSAYIRAALDFYHDMRSCCDYESILAVDKSMREVEKNFRKFSVTLEKHFNFSREIPLYGTDMRSGE